jgi:hypothetical protein
MKAIQYYLFKFIIVLLLFQYCSTLSGQITTVNPAEISVPAPKKDSLVCRNSIYVELLGHGGLYSVNYDYRLGDKISLRVGISIWSMSMDMIIFQLNDVKFRSFPIMVNYLIGERSHRLELGVGLMPTYISTGPGTFFYIINSNPSGHETILPVIATVGYRYQPEKGGIIFRAGATPILVSGRAGFSIGISAGYGF